MTEQESDAGTTRPSNVANLGLAAKQGIYAVPPDSVVKPLLLVLLSQDDHPGLWPLTKLKNYRFLMVKPPRGLIYI